MLPSYRYFSLKKLLISIVIKNFKRRIRNVFIAGLLITLPIALTWFILQFLFKNLDALSPMFTNMLIQLGAPFPEGYRIPFLGVLMTLLIVLMVGCNTNRQITIFQLDFLRRVVLKKELSGNSIIIIFEVTILEESDKIFSIFTQVASISWLIIAPP